MTLQQEFNSWFAPKHTSLSPSIPGAGDQAPSTPSLPFPNPAQRPTILTFLRHCGCPWAEKTYLQLRSAAAQNPSIDFVALSHSSRADTDEWLASLPKSTSGSGDSSSNGREPANLRIVVDDELRVYGAWGLGSAGWLEVVSAPALWAVYVVARDEGIKNRPTRSGSRWQRSGSWAVDAKGVVRWGRSAERADDIMDFQEGVKAVS